MKPIIGITPSYAYEEQQYQLRQDYGKKIEKAGGIPVILTAESGFPNFLDGIVFSGGGDIDPLLFGEEPIVKNGEISPLRDAYELELCNWAMEQNLPLLGICRGMQIFAIVSGGTILQDMETQGTPWVKHSQQAPRWYGTHTVTVEPNSLLAEICKKEELVVNSFHHQTVFEVGEGFSVCGRSKDGFIEAMEKRDSPFILGVQWHPEALPTQEQQAIFDHLITVAKKNCQRKKED